jgi:Predicted membrane protein
MMPKWFNARGRISRREYFFSSVAVYVLTFGWFYVGGLMSANDDTAIKTTGMLLFVTTLVAGGIVNAFLVVRRLHDLGKPGSHAWLLFVPMYSIYLSLVLLFAKGVSGQNQYGPDPVVA